MGSGSGSGYGQGRVRCRGRVWGRFGFRVRVRDRVRVKRVRTEPESRSGSGSIMSSHSMRYVYMRVAARCVYMVLCGCVHAPATSHGGMWPRSAAQGEARTRESQACLGPCLRVRGSRHVWHTAAPLGSKVLPVAVDERVHLGLPSIAGCVGRV